jgi:hypothetical protein
MTGMVKEEILTRQRELGCSIENGQLVFDFLLLDTNEFLAEPTEFDYRDLDGEPVQIRLPADSIAYSICQVPVTLRVQVSDKPCIEVHLSDGSVHRIDGHILDITNSRHIFQRDGTVRHLVVIVPTNK